ncbi:MAG TPA: hypothetical protein VKS43_08695 [Burkholderiales bacterium]|nr:hypothetical protein [Burkholderiales bacterium]
MKTTIFIGVALLAIGAAVLGYDHYSYTTTETVFQVGSIKATTEETHTVALPAILGWLLVGGGVCVLGFGALSKNS